MTWLKQSYASNLPDSLYSYQNPEPVSDPKMILYNEKLAIELGLDKYLSHEDDILSYLSGNEVISETKPIAQAYAGHQFGHFNRLGDGRAVLLGEIDTPRGLYDLQLKGSGRTAYSRRGDGRATFYSMLREYLISESMFALKIPTTRSLAVVKSSDKIYREQIQDGGVLSRVAASHIRVGTFEFARYLGEKGDLEALLRYTIQRHFPELLDHQNQALALLEEVMKLQKMLIINWLRVGFIHGVMNTDNMAIAGETIDYGPCAFMNAYHPKTVFSSIDTDGRYAFGNQPNIAHWNLSVLASALLPLIDQNEDVAKEKAQSVLDRFPADFSLSYLEMMTNKLGIQNQKEQDRDLVKECTRLLTKHKVDYTNFFTELRKGSQMIAELREDENFNNWYLRWEERRFKDLSLTESDALMIEHNPVIIPRNHLVEEVLDSAVLGDMQPFHLFFKQLQSPYEDHSNLQSVPTNFDASYQTFCGT